MLRLLRVLTPVLAVLGAVFAGPATAQNVIHNFVDPAAGQRPQGGVIKDSQGALYGSAVTGGLANAGTIYKLAPPAPGQTQWQYTVLYSFLGGNDGLNPAFELTMDGTGALYGITESGGTGRTDSCFDYGGCGTVFKLTPPPPGGTSWSKTTLYNFDNDNLPISALVIDASGALYGGVFGLYDPNFGSVFKLTPPLPGHLAWTYSTAYAFSGGPDGSQPYYQLVMDSLGNIYGTTGYGGLASVTNCSGECGTIFRLKPPTVGQTAWKHDVLYAFQGGSDGYFPVNLALKGGALYGTTFYGGISGPQCRSCGTVYKLVLPTSANPKAVETVIYRFQGQSGDGWLPFGIAIDGMGNLFGSTVFGGLSYPTKHCPNNYDGCGTIFKLTAPAAGATAWTETNILLDGTKGANPQGAILLPKGSPLYLATSTLGPNTGQMGTVLKLDRKLLSPPP